MRIIYTDEMRRLRKVFEPYEIGCHLIKTAPHEAIEARKKYYELVNKEFEKANDISLL